MRIRPVGKGPDHVLDVIKSAEASATIPAGTPVSLVLNGTDDGWAVVLPSTAGAALANSAFYGVATAALTPGNIGESITFGIVPYAILAASTRAATSDSFSTASFATGNLLCLDTINNAFKLASASLGSNNFLPFALMAQSLTVSGSATATSLTLTVNTVAVRVFVRML